MLPPMYSKVYFLPAHYGVTGSVFAALHNEKLFVGFRQYIATY